MPLESEKELRPNPDPSILTTDQILRENSWLKELLRTYVGGVESTIEAKLSGMDKALVLLQDKADKVPSETDIAVGNLKSQQDERFKSIDTQFVDRDIHVIELNRERDVRTEKLAEAVQKAIDAAFLAQKAMADTVQESNAAAIAKSENATAESIRALGTNVTTAAKGTESTLGDLKDRTTALENRRDPLVDAIGTRLTALENRSNGVREGEKETSTKQQQQWGFIFGIVGMATAAGVLLIEMVRMPH